MSSRTYGCRSPRAACSRMFKMKVPVGFRTRFSSWGDGQEPGDVVLGLHAAVRCLSLFGVGRRGEDEIDRLVSQFTEAPRAIADKERLIHLGRRAAKPSGAPHATQRTTKGNDGPDALVPDRKCAVQENYDWRTFYPPQTDGGAGDEWPPSAWSLRLRRRGACHGATTVIRF